MKRLAALFLLLFLLFLMPLATATSSTILEFEKRYALIDSNNRVYQYFKVYRVDNETVDFIFTSFNARVSIGESLAGPDFSFKVLAISDSTVEVDFSSSKYRLVDPELTILALNPAANQTDNKELSYLEGEIQALNSSITSLKAQLSQIKQQNGVSADEVKKIAENAVSTKMASLSAKVSELENKINALQTLVQQLSQEMQKLKQDKQSWLNSPQMQELIENDPKMALLAVALDPSLSDAQKQQLITQMVLKQKEKEKQAQMMALVVSLAVLGVVIVGVMVWLRKQSVSPHRL